MIVWKIKPTKKATSAELYTAIIKKMKVRNKIDGIEKEEYL